MPPASCLTVVIIQNNSPKASRDHLSKVIIKIAVRVTIGFISKHSGSRILDGQSITLVCVSFNEGIYHCL